MTCEMTSSWRPRKFSKPKTRCSTVAARRPPSATPAATGTPDAPGASGTAGSLVSGESLGEGTRKILRAKTDSHSQVRPWRPKSRDSGLVEPDRHHAGQDQQPADELHPRRHLVQQHPG